MKIDSSWARMFRECAEYTGQFLRYVVTLGHYPFPDRGVIFGESVGGKLIEDRGVGVLGGERMERDFERVNEDLGRFFEKFEETEREFLHSFKNSQHFTDLLEIMRRSSQYSLSAIEEAYVQYKSDLAERAAGARARIAEELDVFKVTLQKSPFFEEFSRSTEYRHLMENSFHSIEEIKVAIDDFEKRNFLENLLVEDRGAFEGSVFYREFMGKPGSTFLDLKRYYRDFQYDRMNAYLEGLKLGIGSERYEEFINSPEFNNPEVRYKVEDMKTAYTQFKKRN